MRARNEETKLKIYEYINEYIKTYRVSPTIKEIAKNANCVVSTAYKFMERLKDEGRKSHQNRYWLKKLFYSCFT